MTAYPSGVAFAVACQAPAWHHRDVPELVPPEPTDARAAAYMLRRRARRIQPSRRVALCGRRASGLVLIRDQEGRGVYHGPYLCERATVCPTCARALASVRQRSLVEAGEAHAKRYWDASQMMVTLTVRHRHGQTLRELLAALRKSWSRFASGRRWRRLVSELGIVGHARAIEVRWTPDGGWHPHLHVAIWTRHHVSRVRWFGGRPYSETDLRVRRYWRDAVARIAPECTPSFERGATLTVCYSQEYIAKLGWELTGSLGKAGKRGSLGTWQLAARAAVAGPGTPEADRWTEYCEAMHGARTLTWSRSMTRPEEPDDSRAIVAEETRGAPVAAIEGHTYRVLERWGVSGVFADLMVHAPADAWEYLREKRLAEAKPGSELDLPPPREPSEWRQPFHVATPDGEILRGKFAHLVSGQHSRGMTTEDSRAVGQAEFLELVRRLKRGLPVALDGPQEESLELRRHRAAFERWRSAAWVPVRRRPSGAIESAQV